MQSEQGTHADDLVAVMVPKILLTDVYAYIASRTAEAPSNGEPTLHRGWSAPLIIEAYERASDRMKVLLDLLATQPDEKLYNDDFLKALGESDPDVVNGVLGAFGRLTNQKFASRLPNRENTWPFTVSKDIRDGRWYYLMPANVAEVIRSAEH
jgi:hypothetical protein